MGQAMTMNKARKRIHNIEEAHLDKLKEAKTRDKLIETILLQIDEDYNKSRELSEDELKKELGKVL